MLTIKPVSEIIPTKALQSSQDPPVSILRTMTPGRVLKIAVIQGGKENALLQWGDLQFRAESKVPLQEGRKLNLLVTENSSRIKLKILENFPQELRTYWPLLTEKNVVSRLLETLMSQPHLLGKTLKPDVSKGLELFQALQESSEALGIERVVQLLRMLGMNCSKTRAGHGPEGDILRSCLEEVLAGLKEPDSDLGRKLETILAGLQKNTMTGQGGKEPEAYFTLLPLPFLEKGFLVFQREGAENQTTEDVPWRLSLVLETESLGEMQIDFLEEKNGLLIKFMSASSAVREHMESCQEEFKEIFRTVPLRGLTFETAKELPSNFLFRKIAGGSEGVLETWA